MRLSQVATYIPLGIIGLWRWVSWMIRRTPALFYRPVRSDHREDVTCVTPVYQEDPEQFTRAIVSWLANPGVVEIIAVIDETDTACQEIAFALRRSGRPIRVIVTSVPGKRDALRRGWEAARTNVVALVDSDTVWAADVSVECVQPFADRRIGGVGTRQNVSGPRGFWHRITDVFLDYRYFDEIASETVAGGAVSCLSGRTAFYRRELLLQISSDFMNEHFMGVPCNSGDDKRLTMLTLRAGYLTVLQRSARVWSTFPRNARMFLKQRLRWARNSWRSDLRSLGSGWIWRHLFLAYTLADKAISSFTLLMAPSYFGFALVTGNLWFAMLLSAWWMVSRSAKNLPHLRRRPVDTFLMPMFVFVTFLMALVKIYALLTVRTQRWITRDVAVIDGRIVRLEGVVR